MAVGFVLISSGPGKERDVYSQVEKIDGVTEAHPLFGEYDIIARIEAPDQNAMLPVVRNIRKVPGVMDTKTLPGMPSYQEKK